MTMMRSKNSVKEFDEKVVFNKKAPDISEYEKYYQQIEPENAEDIYKQVIFKTQYTKESRRTWKILF